MGERDREIEGGRGSECVRVPLLSLKCTVGNIILNFFYSSRGTPTPVIC